MDYNLMLKSANKQCHDIVKDGEVFGGWGPPGKPGVCAFGVCVWPFMKRAYARPIYSANFTETDR